MNDESSSPELRLLFEMAEKQTRFAAAAVIQFVELRAMLATVMDLQRLILQQAGHDIETVTEIARQSFEENRKKQERLVRETLDIVEMATEKPGGQVM